ncbi:MAG: type II toxin-antitoxin system HicB family antitoxin [bacterium]
MKKVTRKNVNKDIYFKVFKSDGWYVAAGVGVLIVTQGKTLDELYDNVKDAVRGYFEVLAEKNKVKVSKPSIFMKFQSPVSA